MYEYERIVENLAANGIASNSGESIDTHRQRITETDVTLSRFEQHIDLLVRKGKTVEREEEEGSQSGRERTVSM